MTLSGDFAAEKEQVRSEMQRRLDELQKDEVLPPRLKELTLTIGVTSIFCYSAGVVPWTRSELEVITKMWIRAYMPLSPSTFASAPLYIAQGRRSRPARAACAGQCALRCTAGYLARRCACAGRCREHQPNLGAKASRWFPPFKFLAFLLPILEKGVGRSRAGKV